MFERQQKLNKNKISLKLDFVAQNDSSEQMGQCSKLK